MGTLESEQLSALGEIHSVLGRAGIEHWLFGGWAVDFYAGSVTRAHADIDMAVWLEDFSRISELLASDGWQHVPSDEDDGGTGFERGRVRFEITFLVRERGQIITPLRHGRAEWSKETFADDSRELRGVRAQVVALAALTEGKSVARNDAEDAAKDHADFDVLSKLHPKA